MWGGRMAGDRQERLRQGWRGAGDASRFDSRPALGRGGGREGVRERRRSDNRGDELRGRTREGSGPERDTSAGASRAARRGPGGLQAPPPPPPPPPSLTDSASSPHSSRGRPEPNRGTSRAASPGLCHRYQLRLRPGSAREGAGAERAEAAAPGRTRGRAGGCRSEPSSPLGVRSHRRRCHRRPALTRRRSSATSADSDAPEAGLSPSRDSRGLGPDRTADWRAALGGGALRQLADG